MIPAGAGPRLGPTACQTPGGRTGTAWWLAVASIGLTVAYSVRLHRLAFRGAPRAPLHTLLGAPEAGLGGAFYPGGVAVALLAALSLGAGYLLSAVFLPFGEVFNGGTP